MPAIRVRVGASLDANLATLFRPLTEGSKRARAIVAAEMKGLAGDIRKSLHEASAEAARELGGISRRTLPQSAGAGAAFEPMRRGAQTAVRAMVHEFDSGLSRIEANVRRFGYTSMQTLGRAFRGAGRLGLDIARGAGIDMSLGGIVGRSVGLQTRAIDLSNAASKEGRRAVDPKAIIAQARAVGQYAAIDPEKAVEGLQKFTAKTGDLQTAQDILARIARLSQATGAELDNMVDASGDVASALGDVPDKGTKVYGVMKMIAGQGKEGAVEIKDLAVQMAKIASAAGAFEGDVGQNIETLGAFAQMARQRGGAASATQAATSVAALLNTFKTPARIAAFRAEGIDVVNKQGMIRDPVRLMTEALSKTGGDFERMKKMFANVQGERAIAGFATVYRQGRAAAESQGMRGSSADLMGIEAVRKELERFTRPVSEQTIETGFQRKLEGDASKVQRFNNELGKIGEELAGRLLPQLEKLAPVVVELVDKFAGVVAWAAENPGMAITSAIVASIAKAGAETAIRSALEGTARSILGGVLGGGGGLGGLGAGVGGAGGLAGGAGAAGLAGIAAGVGYALPGAAVMLGAAELEGAQKEAAQRARSQAAIAGVDADRQKINGLLRNAGVAMPEGAGLGTDLARRLAGDEATGDALQGIAGSGRGGLLSGLTEEQRTRLSASLLGSASLPPTAQALKSPGELAGGEAAVPTLKELLAEQRNGNRLLQAIATQGIGPSGAPVVDQGARSGPAPR